MLSTAATLALGRRMDAHQKVRGEKEHTFFDDASGLQATESCKRLRKFESNHVDR